MIAQISILIPSVSAETFAGQMQWFAYGYVYSAIIGTVGLMIRLFRMASSTGPEA